MWKFFPLVLPESVLCDRAGVLSWYRCWNQAHRERRACWRETWSWRWTSSLWLQPDMDEWWRCLKSVLWVLRPRCLYREQEQVRDRPRLVQTQQVMGAYLRELTQLSAWCWQPGAAASTIQALLYCCSTCVFAKQNVKHALAGLWENGAED